MLVGDIWSAASTEISLHTRSQTYVTKLVQVVQSISNAGTLWIFAPSGHGFHFDLQSLRVNRF